jgi:hypothetical protein
LFVVAPSIARAEQITISASGLSNPHTTVDVTLSYTDKGKPEYVSGHVTAGPNTWLMLLKPATMTNVVFTGKAVEGARLCEDTQRYPTFRAEVKLNMSKCRPLGR